MKAPPFTLRNLRGNDEAAIKQDTKASALTHQSVVQETSYFCSSTENPDSQVTAAVPGLVIWLAGYKGIDVSNLNGSSQPHPNELLGESHPVFPEIA